MSEEAIHLGALEESTDRYRLRAQERAFGYWALARSGDRAFLSLHVHNLHPLQEDAPYVYQPWLVPAEGRPVPLPPFNTSADGSGFCTVAMATARLALGVGARLLIAAEPRTPDPAQAAPTVLGGPWLTLEPTADAGGEQGDSTRDLLVRQNEPATPVTATHPRDARQVQEMLAPVHPLARNAAGTVVFDFTHDGVVVTLHDAPGPDVYGVDPVTDRPFNVYAGWLVRRDTGDVAPLGFFRKVWPGTYRLQARRAAPLASFDTLLVSAEDRAGAFDPLNRRAFSTAYSPLALPAVEPTQSV